MAKAKQYPLGIDIGGSGIKGAPVDLDKGEFAKDRLRVPTPEKSTPEAVADCVVQIVEHFSAEIGDEAVGITIPGVVTHGVVRTAANIDKSWTDFPIEEELEKRLGRNITVLNDADAAGLGEWHYGAAKKWTEGLVVMTTLGTGIGSALLNNGVLVPNSEFGHLEIDGFDAEKRAASSVKDNEGLSYEEWAERLQRYYSHVENLFWPDLFVVGGGVSKDAEEFLPLLKIRTKIVAAELENRAGIIGAAHLAQEYHDNRR